ncbi:uncharacterized protein A1O9_07939 [Exophiala aquamarina CBS 119918]|uniref:Acyltransferase 3 domain-containing protein n=1 Tax=Exophiala aquamarina CBS 119918 TaxID=1182545 RepID=A0A072PAS3_9EURO|nr:uncharacterized protein A1O9_07939 [Exophiala aquamarina CBS 119918]KEF56358.1 hypothetical protein A1O9_07939 [Exophiala aquamarina CBS 119918]
MTDQYQPLVKDVAQSSHHSEKPTDYDVEAKEVADHDDEDDDIELKEIDLSRLPEESRPKWYQLPQLRVRQNWDISSRLDLAKRWDSVPDVKTLARLVLSYAVTILPRYMQPGGLKVKKELHPTAYLDAVRGWAALAVFRYHGIANKTWLLEQPVFRMVLNGRAMVDVFFVISGYVLTYRMLKLIRNRQNGLLRALASSTFRRWWRLYVSTGIATLITAIWTYWGWCQPQYRQPTLWLQLIDWAWDWGASSNPFGDIRGWWYATVFRTKYLDQMWTIPVEFRGSLVVFWFCAASAYLSTRGRRIFCLVAIALCYYWGAIYAALFLLGEMIADYSFDRHPERLQRIRLPTPQESEGCLTPERRQSIPSKICYTVLLIIAMFLLGQPSDGYWAIGPFPWPYLSKAIPWYYNVELGEHFWLSWGSVLFIFALDNCRMLQIPFEWRFSQYLGDLSFGIYAMHNSLLWVLYTPIVEPWRASHLGDGYWSGLPGIVFTTLVLLWLADYFTRIDQIVVRVGRWLETMAFIEWT